MSGNGAGKYQCGDHLKGYRGCQVQGFQGNKIQRAKKTSAVKKLPPLAILRARLRALFRPLGTIVMLEGFQGVPQFTNRRRNYILSIHFFSRNSFITSHRMSLVQASY